jgi:hypothetical protein
MITMALLTTFFKAVIRDVASVVELATLINWEPEHDLSDDAREIVQPVGRVEERARHVYQDEQRHGTHPGPSGGFRKEHQARCRTRDGDKLLEFWFEVPLLPAQSLENHEPHMIAYL